MVCAPVRSIIPSLKLGDYLSVQAHKPCSISHMYSAKQCRDHPRDRIHLTKADSTSNTSGQRLLDEVPNVSCSTAEQIE